MYSKRLKHASPNLKLNSIVIVKIRRTNFVFFILGILESGMKLLLPRLVFLRYYIDFVIIFVNIILEKNFNFNYYSRDIMIIPTFQYSISRCDQ